ncbi:MAG: 50S ribosomal protein L35 [Bacilli bacterium]|nr:50S ribosomal protein L35 [Bacilli bacterium]
MGKMKTHKGTKKAVKLHKSGLVTYKFSGGNHKTSKDSPKEVRQRRTKGKLAKGMAKKIIKAI